MATAKKAVKKVVKKVAAKRTPRVPTIPKYIFDRVEHGVQLLDLILGRKEWLGRINLGDFDIKDPNTCVAGSVWANVYAFDTSGLNTDDGFDVFTNMLELMGGEGTAYKFGFNAANTNDEQNTEFQQLQDVWVRSLQLMKKCAK